MGNEYWDQRETAEEMERHVKRLEEAKKKQEERKKEDKERLENIKQCWIEGKVILSDLDISWLIMKAEKGVE
jgi:hypothetical protein